MKGVPLGVEQISAARAAAWGCLETSLETSGCVQYQDATPHRLRKEHGSPNHARGSCDGAGDVQAMAFIDISGKTDGRSVGWHR